jgi:5'-nucleotidase
MNILITNDDGIEADGLIRLAEAAKEFGEVWVVAPKRERSAASHSITLRRHIDVYPHNDFPVEGVKAYHCSGKPADCVRVGALAVMPEKPDLVLSGINYGYNSATDIQYSATVGAAFEAAFQGIHAIALSEGFSKCHEVTDKYLHDLIAELIDVPLKYGQVHNVNFPDCPLSECKGVLYDRKVSRGTFYIDSYKEVEKLPDGGSRLMVDGKYNEDAEEGTDFKAIVDKYVSVGIVNNIG